MGGDGLFRMDAAPHDALPDLAGPLDLASRRGRRCLGDGAKSGSHRGSDRARRRHGAKAADVTSPDTDIAAPVVVHRPLADPGEKSVRGAAVPEDEAGLKSKGSREHRSRAPVRPVRVVVRIIEHHHPESRARIVVWVPGPEADVRMTVVAEEARIVVVPLHVVRRDVVVPITVVSRGRCGRRAR